MSGVLRCVEGRGGEGRVLAWNYNPDRNG